jgi:hypothetical protein
LLEEYMKFDELEKDLMKFLLAGDDPVLATLREQYAVSVIMDRTFTGVGSFTSFVIPEGTTPVKPANIEINDVFLQLQGVKFGFLVILFVRNGYMSTLEIVHVSTDLLPEEPVVKSISYRRTNKGDFNVRDMEALRHSWSGRQ